MKPEAPHPVAARRAGIASIEAGEAFCSHKLGSHSRRGALAA